MWRRSNWDINKWVLNVLSLWNIYLSWIVSTFLGYFPIVTWLICKCCASILSWPIGSFAFLALCSGIWCPHNAVRSQSHAHRAQIIHHRASLLYPKLFIDPFTEGLVNLQWGLPYSLWTLCGGVLAAKNPYVTLVRGQARHSGPFHFCFPHLPPPFPSIPWKPGPLDRVMGELAVATSIAWLQ
jgi:hypothetical protein